MNLESIYNVSPYWLQNIMCSAKGFLINQRRYGHSFYKELRNFEVHQYNPLKELLFILEFCKDIPFYKDVLSESFLRNLSDSNVEEKMKELPVIRKSDIRQRVMDFAKPNCDIPFFLMHTSGTTGSGLIFPYSNEMENKQWAVWWRYRRALGIQLDTWCGWFGGKTIIPLSSQKPPYWRVNRPGRQVMYSSYHLNSDTINYYYNDIRKRSLKWLHGYPSSVTLLANLFIENNLGPIESVKWVTTGAENLLAHQMDRIKAVFPNCIVRNHYGQSEGVANFSQDKDGKWKIDDDFAYVEFIPVDENDSTICRIVGTGFSNKAFPLIRYDTGDLAKINWSNGKPEIIEIYGRQEDYIELPNGVKLGRLDHIFKDCVNIKEAQIHQIRKDLIELKVVKDNHYSPSDERFLLKEASTRFGNDVQITICYCDRIERTKSGKVRFVISDIINK